MKKYERRPVFLEPHVLVRSVFNNRIFAVIGSPFFVRSAVIAYTYPYSVQVMRASTRSVMSVGSEKGVILDSLSTEPTEQETGI